MRSRLFWLISRSAACLYRLFPFRGYLRGAVGIIQREGGYVAVQRNDGFGLAFPGGMCRRGEDPSQTLAREVREETGLEVSSAVFLFSYRDTSLYPSETHVFRADASGTLRGSWEGVPLVAPLDTLRGHIMCSQRPIIEWIENPSESKEN
ncbi:MAG: NUDIX hydrolase [Acidobacteria bacterium]|nr:NUDIX hydrolase [Acidobacteriota bacterium]